jgi:hypothetical protein
MMMMIIIIITITTCGGGGGDVDMIHMYKNPAIGSYLGRPWCQLTKWTHNEAIVSCVHHLVSSPNILNVFVLLFVGHLHITLSAEFNVDRVVKI